MGASEHIICKRRGKHYGAGDCLGTVSGRYDSCLEPGAFFFCPIKPPYQTTRGGYSVLSNRVPFAGMNICFAAGTLYVFSRQPMWGHMDKLW